MVLTNDINSGSCFQFCNRANTICATSSMNDLVGSKFTENDAVSGGDFSDTDTDDTDGSESSSKGIIENILDLLGGFLNISDSDEENEISSSKPPKERRKVRFDRVVKVVLIRNRFEYLQHGLIPKLWFFEEDYAAAKLERIQEIKEKRRLEMFGEMYINGGDVTETKAPANKNGIMDCDEAPDRDGRAGADYCRSSDFNCSDRSDDRCDMIEGDCHFYGNEDDDDYYVRDLSTVYPVKQDADSIKWDIVNEIEKNLKDMNCGNVLQDEDQANVADGRAHCNSSSSEIRGKDNGANGSSSNSSDCNDSSGASRDVQRKIANIRRCHTFKIHSRGDLTEDDRSINGNSS